MREANDRIVIPSPISSYVGTYIRSSKFQRISTMHCSARVGCCSNGSRGNRLGRAHEAGVQVQCCRGKRSDGIWKSSSSVDRNPFSSPSASPFILLLLRAKKRKSEIGQFKRPMPSLSGSSSWAAPEPHWRDCAWLWGLPSFHEIHSSLPRLHRPLFFLFFSFFLCSSVAGSRGSQSSLIRR